MDVDARPFDFPPKDEDRRRGVLLIHGFTGTPYEVRPVGAALSTRGLRAVGPLLPGHGLDARALNRTGWQDWVAAMDERLAALRQQVERIAVVGLSLGGLIALDLARRNPDLAALAVLGTPLWIPAPLAHAARTVIHVSDTFPKLGGSDIRDAIVKASFPSLDRFPLAALVSLLDFQPIVRAGLGQVTVPTLVMHADHDHVAPPACAAELIARLGASDKRLVRLPRSFHIITVDVERELVAQTIGDFLCERM